MSSDTQPPPDAAKRPPRVRATAQGAAVEPAPDPAAPTLDPAAPAPEAEPAPGATTPGPTPHAHEPHAHAAHGHTAHGHTAHGHAAHAHAPRHRKPHAEVAHATRGRVRIKIPAAKTTPGLLDQIKAAFEKHPGIDAIDVKQSTGSIVIYYDPEHHEDIPSLFASMDQAAAAPMAHMAPLAAPPPAPAAPAHHRPAATKLDDELDAIEAEAEFLAEHSHAARAIVDFIKALDRQLKRSTNNNIDLKILAPVGLAAFTILEIGVATATPVWVTLMLFSLNHFVELHAHDADKP